MIKTILLFSALFSSDLCKERGHVRGETVTYAVDHHDKLVDTKDSTYILIQSGNFGYYTCQRCGERVEEIPVETKKVLWISPEIRNKYWDDAVKLGNHIQLIPYGY